MRPLDPRLLRQVRGARAALALDVALGVLAALALLTQAVLFARVVAGAFEGSTAGALGRSLALLAAAAIARGVLAGAFESTGRRAAGRIMSRLRMNLVRSRLRAPPFADDAVEAGEVATSAVQGIDALETYFGRYLPQAVLAVLVPVAVLAWTAAIDPTSAAIMLVTLPLIPLFMVLIGRLAEARTRARWQALAGLSNHFLDVVRGLPTLRAFNRGPAQAGRIEETSERYRAATMDVLRVSFLSGAVLEFMATIATALVAVALGLRLVDGDIGLAPALTVLLLTPELYAPLRAVAAQYHASADGLAAAERILGLTEPAGGSHLPLRSASALPVPVWTAVRLEGVTVAYPGRGSPALERFDLEIGIGEVVALVGASGAGKSTAASLLLGLRAPDAGRVMIDDTDLASLDLVAWRRQVAWLPQRPTIFHGSVRDNIAMADPGASEAAVEDAARRAMADGFVRELPDAYETAVGAGGRGLSAGEARRIALARALLRNAPLLVLDEPTANLDAESAAAVAATIRGLRGRAVLLIAHEPSIAEVADRVVPVQRGGARRNATLPALAAR